MHKRKKKNSLFRTTIFVRKFFLFISLPENKIKIQTETQTLILDQEKRAQDVNEMIQGRR